MGLLRCTVWCYTVLSGRCIGRHVLAISTVALGGHLRCRTTRSCQRIFLIQFTSLTTIQPSADPSSPKLRSTTTVSHQSGYSGCLRHEHSRLTDRRGHSLEPLDIVLDSAYSIRRSTNCLNNDERTLRPWKDCRPRYWPHDNVT